MIPRKRIRALILLTAVIGGLVLLAAKPMLEMPGGYDGLSLFQSRSGVVLSVLITVAALIPALSSNPSKET